MILARRSADRGHFDLGWLDTRHTFSFGDYHDPAHMGFRALRVLNEDRIAPGRGFGRHGHRDMEILTLVLAGALRHEDSLGNSSVIRPGEVQRMSAGTGVLHAEANPSDDEPVHLLQIWLVPDRRGYAPSYEQIALAPTPGWRLVAAPDGRDGATTVHQDVSVFVGRLAPDTTLRHALSPGRRAWVQVVRGSLLLNDVRLSAGDGAAVGDERALTLTTDEEALVLLFDLA